MPVQPDKKLEQINFALNHIDVWTTAAAQIGLTTAQATLVKTSATTASDSYQAALQARQASKAATMKADDDLKAMKEAVAEAVKSIRLYAETTNNEQVYATAQIPAPAPRTPALPPTKPVNLSFTIEPSGALTLSWTNAASSAGYDASTQNVIYTVRRRISATGSGTFAIVGAVPAARSGRRGLTSFTDDTLPRGSSNIQYLVVPQRGTLTGPSSEVYTVNLGVGSGAGLTISAAPATNADLKMAA